MDAKDFLPLLKNSRLENDKIIITDNLHDIIANIKQIYNYDMLKNITAADNGNSVELIYHLYSIENQDNLLISISVENEAESICDIYESAKADENEIYDMFGIKFTGNKDLKRLYMPDGWIGHPLRKDYIENDTRLAWNDKNNA